MFKFVTQYAGLRKENYILFIGRIVTNMGSMIWPVLTLILTQKLGMTAADASVFTIILGAIQLPLGLLGGKLADKFNKKYIIIFFDSISIFFYIVCAFLPLNFTTIILLSVGALFQTMEGPAYDTLISDISTTEQREKAYSLSYLGMNLGLVLSPTIAGFLFANYLWLSFLISGVAIGLSTLLIALFVKDIAPVEEHTEMASYQAAVDENVSTWKILFKNPIIFVYIIEMTLFWCAYGQWSFLLPIDIAAVHGANTGARIYGMISSENCIIVVILTPFITQAFAKLFQTKKMIVAIALVLMGYLGFLVGLGYIPVYFGAIGLFTIGEIFMTIASGPYISKRIPASHRGRINGILNIIQSVLAGIAMFAIGQLHTNMGSKAAWILVLSMLVGAIAVGIVVIVLDKVYFPKLYTEAEQENNK